MYVVAALTLIASCSGDDSSSGSDAGSGGASGAGSGANGGSSGDTGGSSGANGGDGGSSGAAGAGAGGDGGSSGGGTGGDGAADGGGELDSGTDSGVPGNEFACVAPTPSTDFGAECPAEDPVTLKLTPLRTDLNVPIFVTHAPDDESRLFVVQRGGQILILDREDGATIGTFLDIGSQATTGTNEGHEYGLLGLAFHPNYPEDPRIFVNYTIDGYTTDDGDEYSLETLVTSFEVSDDPNVIDMSSEQILVRFGQPQENHNGGMLAFGKDNCLYVGAGDGGNGNDTGPGHSAGGNGQDLSKPLGKILRIDQDDPSVRAPGNPTDPEYEHIWDYGVRNPWRFSFDRDTGDMYIGDVGQDEIEEVSVAPRGVGNNNFGWPIMEGASCFGGGGCDMDGLVLPAYDYPHAANSENCVIGGYVYRGSAIPSLHGWYLYGDSGTGRRIRAFVWDGEAACDTAVPLSERDGLTLNGRITSFGEDAAGELYVTTAAGLYRIDQAE